MKIDLVQFNPRIGDIDENLAKILEHLKKARSRRTEVLIFPELALTGYPPQDLIFSPAHTAKEDAAIRRITHEADSVTIIVGCTTRRGDIAPFGRRTQNSAAVITSGKPVTYYHKRLLPTYDVFDEDRYFEPGATPLIVSVGRETLGITICEDIWDPEKTRYSTHPPDDYRKKHLTALVNISASPFHTGRPDERRTLLHSIATNLGCPIVYCNQVGGNDELVFDGCSQVVHPNGSITSMAGAFEECCLVDVLNPSAPATQIQLPQRREEWILGALCLGTRDFIHKNGFEKVVVGLSGGIDSAVVAALAARALGSSNVHGVLLSSRYTSSDSVEDAAFIARNLGIHFHPMSIANTVREAKLQLEATVTKGGVDTLEENIQPRVRMVFLMAVANHLGGMLLNTSNKSEIATGYSTQYGDTAGALGVIGDLVKREVYALGRHLNQSGPFIPERVFLRPPTAELKPNQTDQDRLPPYPVLDEMVKRVIDGGESFDSLTEFEPRWVDCFRKLYSTSEFKRRQFPPILRVSRKAFGMGRRIPITAQTV